MELPVLAVLLASFILTTNSHPKHSDIIPKDYYKRQILQPIPGYIPVYIQTDEEPIVRSEIKHSPDVHPQKVTEPKEENLFKQSDEKNVPNNEGQKLDEIKSEVPVKEPESSAKLEPTTNPANLNEKKAEVKS